MSNYSNQNFPNFMYGSCCDWSKTSKSTEKHTFLQIFFEISSKSPEKSCNILDINISENPTPFVICYPQELISIFTSHTITETDHYDHEVMYVTSLRTYKHDHIYRYDITKTNDPIF